MDPDSGCPSRVEFVMVNVATGQIAPMRCGRNACPYCLRVNARRRGAAIAFAAPQRAILLTQVGDDWSQVRDRMKRLRYDLAQEVGEVNWAWHVEPNPAGTGHHVHAWQHGHFIPQPALSAMAGRRGMGRFARINRVRSTTAAGRYGLKGLGYGLKGIAAADAGAGYLRDNGDRLTHQSRGYFRTPEGAKLPVKVAERLALGQQSQEGRWVPMLRALVEGGSGRASETLTASGSPALP